MKSQTARGPAPISTLRTPFLCEEYRATSIDIALVDPVFVPVFQYLLHCLYIVPVTSHQDYTVGVHDVNRVRHSSVFSVGGSINVVHQDSALNVILGCKRPCSFGFVFERVVGLVGS